MQCCFCLAGVLAEDSEISYVTISGHLGGCHKVGLLWILLGLSAICGIIFIYPYVIYPLVLALVPRKPIEVGECNLRVSLLFCAYNEIESLPEKLENLRSLKAALPSLEILAYDDNSDDGTTELLAGATDVLKVVPGAGRTGKAAGMKRLAKMATGDILVFTDANVILAPDAIDRLLPYYADDQIGGVCGLLRYLKDESSATSEVGTAYWNLDEHLRSLESATGDVMGADGSIFSIRKSLYPEFPDTVLDDFMVSMSVIFAGKRLIKAPDVIAYEKSIAKKGEEMRRKVRIGVRAYHTHLKMLTNLRKMSLLNRFKYSSRKIMRWFGGISLASSYTFGMTAIAVFSPTLAISLLVIQIILAILSFCTTRGLLAKANEVLTAIFATLVGVLQGMRGRTVVTWSPAKSR